MMTLTRNGWYGSGFFNYAQIAKWHFESLYILKYKELEVGCHFFL